MKNTLSLAGKENSRNNLWPICLVFLIPICAIFLASLMYFYDYGSPKDRTNYGMLLSPSLPLKSLSLKINNLPFFTENLSGHWAILMFSTPLCKTEQCKQVLYKTRQVHTALGKDYNRVIRLFITKNSIAIPETLRLKHPGSIWVNTSEDIIKKVFNISIWPYNYYYIVDPLGNIIMKYTDVNSGSDLFKDLKILLKASKIG